MLEQIFKMYKELEGAKDKKNVLLRNELQKLLQKFQINLRTGEPKQQVQRKEVLQPFEPLPKDEQPKEPEVPRTLLADNSEKGLEKAKARKNKTKDADSDNQ